MVSSMKQSRKSIRDKQSQNINIYVVQPKPTTTGKDKDLLVTKMITLKSYNCDKAIPHNAYHSNT